MNNVVQELSAIRKLKDEMLSLDTHQHKKLQEEQGADLSEVRKFNRQLVLNCIRQHGSLPRVRIADRLNLSRTTVSSIVDELIKDGWVYEGNWLKAAQNGGRPGGKRALKVHFKADAGYIIGIDIGRSHLIILLTDLEANIKDRLLGSFDTSRGARICLREIADKVKGLVETTDGVTWENVLGIGIGIPGTLDPELRSLITPPQMPKWKGIDIPAYLRERLKEEVPIYLDNDANMGALGESGHGAGRGIANMVYVKIGTGIGAGLILEEHLYRGRRGTAGEFGHITIDENGPLCDSNDKASHRGCLEVLAAEPAIVRDAREGMSLKNTYPYITERPALAGHTGKVDIDEVVQEAQNGDLACRAAIESAGRHIGIALAGLIDLLNPEKILLDGSVIRAADELLMTPLCDSAKERSLPAAWQGTDIRVGELCKSRDASALGAVTTVIDKAFGKLNTTAPSAMAMVKVG